MRNLGCVGSTRHFGASGTPKSKDCVTDFRPGSGGGGVKLGDNTETISVLDEVGLDLRVGASTGGG